MVQPDLSQGYYYYETSATVHVVCDSADSLQYETDYLNNVFSKNNYNTDFVRWNTLSNTDVQTNVNSAPFTTATIPYISQAPLKLSHVYYNLTIYVLHANR